MRGNPGYLTIPLLLAHGRERAPTCLEASTAVRVRVPQALRREFAAIGRHRSPPVHSRCASVFEIGSSPRELRDFSFFVVPRQVWRNVWKPRTSTPSTSGSCASRYRPTS